MNTSDALTKLGIPVNEGHCAHCKRDDCVWIPVLDSAAIEAYYIGTCEDCRAIWPDYIGPVTGAGDRDVQVQHMAQLITAGYKQYLRGVVRDGWVDGPPGPIVPLVILDSELRDEIQRVSEDTFVAACKVCGDGPFWVELDFESIHWQDRPEDARRFVDFLKSKFVV